MKLIEPGWKAGFRIPNATETYSSIADVGKTLGATKISKLTGAFTGNASHSESIVFSKLSKDTSMCQLNTYAIAQSPPTSGNTASAYAGIKTQSQVNAFEAMLDIYMYGNAASTPLVQAYEYCYPYLRITDYNDTEVLLLDLKSFAVDTGFNLTTQNVAVGVSVYRTSPTQVQVRCGRIVNKTTGYLAGYTNTLTIGNGFYAEIYALAQAGIVDSAGVAQAYTNIGVYPIAIKEL